MSAQDKLDRSAAKHGLGSDKRIRRIKKAKDFFSKPVPTYSKDELRKMGHPVEQNEGRFDINIPAPKGPNKNTDKQVAAKAARRAARRAKNDTTKIDKAVAKDKARSANAQGSNTRKYDSIRKNYQSGASGAHFSNKYESSVEYGKSMDRIRDKEKNAAIKPKDRKTLSNLTDLMKKQRKEAYRKPTQAEIDADKRKERKASGEKRPSASYKSIKKKVYGNAMGGLKDAAGQEFTAVPLDTTGEVSGGDRMSIAKLDAIMQKRSKDKRQKESVDLEENKIFFVKVGDGRDHMTVKVKAPNSREALKKMRAQHPKDKVSLDQNQKQGRSAGALESVETNESSLPPHLQKIIGKDGQINKKKVDQHVHGKKTKVTDVTPKGYGPKEEGVDEATMADRTVLRAVRIAKDMAGNHTGASKRIEKMKKGLSDHPKVKDALRLANESVATADKKPQNYRDPETGKLKTRMVPVDKDVVRGNDVAKAVKKKTFRSVRSEQMATGNSRVGKDGRDAFMKAFKDIQKTAAEIQKKKDADKK